MARWVEDMRKASAGANLNRATGRLLSNPELEPKLHSLAANQGAAERENEENYFRFPQRIQPRAAYVWRRLRHTLWFQRVMAAAGGEDGK